MMNASGLPPEKSRCCYSISGKANFSTHHRGSGLARFTRFRFLPRPLRRFRQQRRPGPDDGPDGALDLMMGRNQLLLFTNNDFDFSRALFADFDNNGALDLMMGRNQLRSSLIMVTVPSPMPRRAPASWTNSNSCRRWPAISMATAFST